MSEKVNNIKELAEKIGLSVTTVSRVLNGKSKNYRISADTSRKVLEAAQKFNYHPNHIARGLKLEKTETLGLIIPDIANPYFGSIAKTIEVEARLKGYSIILCDSLDDTSSEAELLQLMAGRKVDGIIIAPVGKESEHIIDISNQGIPLVIIDRYFPNIGLPYVTTDNYTGAFNAVEHIVENGHKKIACIQGINGISANNERLRGYFDALTKNNISIDEDYIVGNDFGEENGYIQAKTLLKHYDPPTAIFAFSNLISIGALRALKESGLKVPEDMSIVSFDEQPYSALLECPMTTVKQPREEIGKMAFQFLLKIIENGDDENISGIKLKPKLIVRESIMKLKKISAIT